MSELKFDDLKVGMTLEIQNGGTGKWHTCMVRTLTHSIDPEGVLHGVASCMLDPGNWASVTRDKIHWLRLPQEQDPDDDVWYVEHDESLPSFQINEVFRIVRESARKRRVASGSSARPDYLATVYSKEDAERIVQLPSLEKRFKGLLAGSEKLILEKNARIAKLEEENADLGQQLVRLRDAHEKLRNRVSDVRARLKDA